MHVAIRILYCYVEFKLRYLKNVKLFSIGVNWLIEPLVLPRKGDGCLLFLKAFSWETDLWVTLGDFAFKHAKLGMEICIQLKIDLVETKFPVRKIITDIWVICVQKNSQFRTLIKHLLAKYQFSQKLPQISHIHKYCIFFKVKLDFFRPTASNFMVVAWEKYSVSILPLVSC